MHRIRFGTSVVYTSHQHHRLFLSCFSFYFDFIAIIWVRVTVDSECVYAHGTGHTAHTFPRAIHLFADCIGPMDIMTVCVRCYSVLACGTIFHFARWYIHALRCSNSSYYAKNITIKLYIKCRCFLFFCVNARLHALIQFRKDFLALKIFC